MLTILIFLLAIIALPYALRSLAQLSLWAVVFCIGVVCYLWIRSMF